jgi:cyclopropane fatty-acyl-phospholipid synthase-like methyltransferase
LEKKQKLRVLDVGAGWGQALDELKEEFGDRVETHALVLKATPELLGTQKQRGRIDQIHQVAIETFLPKQEYDLIVSFFGGMVYSAHPDIAIQKIAHSLSVGGVAYLHLSEFEAFNIKYKRPLELGPNFLADIDSYYETVVIRRLR